MPCQNCTVRQESAKCTYKAINPGPSSKSRHVNQDAMRQRISRLESLVTSMVAQQPHSPSEETVSAPISMSFGSGGVQAQPTPPPEVVRAYPDGGGVIKLVGDQSFYHGSTHWADVLEEVQALKSTWDQVQSDDLMHSVDESNVPDGPSLLYGLASPIELSEILASIPSKTAVDKMLRVFFNFDNPTVPTLRQHPYPSSKPVNSDYLQYEEHWTDPSKSSLMWIGLLFSILNLVMTGHGQLEDELPEYKGMTESLADLYRQRTAQCLMMADIAKCLPYTVETLIFNIMAEYSRPIDNQRRVWMMIAVAVRAALQMGYHRQDTMIPVSVERLTFDRDPSNFPNISLLEGEMRRRTWSFLQELDSLTSFVVGLPSMIGSLGSDTAEARNVHDWELSEDMVELPPSRPSEERTAVGFLITKSRVIKGLSGVVESLSSFGHNAYDSVLALDRHLDDLYNQIPSWIRLPDLKDVAKDSSVELAGRIKIEFYHHQGICALHRRFIGHSRSQEAFEPSRRRSLISAQALLSLQNFLYEESKIRGTYRPPLWYWISHANNDFILPATMIFLELHRRKENHAEGSRELWIMSGNDLELLRALQTSQSIWEAATEHSPQASRMCRILAYMVNSFSITARPLDTALQSISISVPHTGLRSPSISQSPGIGLDSDIDWVSLSTPEIFTSHSNIVTAKTAWTEFVERPAFENAYLSVPINDDWSML
ncbi:hypothetical protein BP6252_09513 [Coleophoma cylindrospora]|uniref:Xylanolytic transcriptional activator regulatory domain-containing protein n=1 Tax=Coleophoma cylindrospora TaxID=1849047 RepID=A0A3D8R261_9HELO|nr:hypothetical protein BP6252_09513 [Coleophoma cylindrospora]